LNYSLRTLVVALLLLAPGNVQAAEPFESRVRKDEGPLRARIVQLACDYGGYGVPRILDLLRRRGWQVNRKRRMRVVIDEFSRECLAIVVARGLQSKHVLECLSVLFTERGTPAYIRSDNGPEFTAAAVRKWLGQVGVGTLFIEPGSPWENGYVESFNGKFRAELLNRELFDTLLEAQVLVERWRHEYNTFRPHSTLGYRPPAPEAIEPKTALGVR
jgi:transposase InsO family protein